jgi:hypothetical protein
MTQDQILQAIYRACNTLNEEQPADRQIICAPETRLFGSSTVIDSLKLVHLILAIEREIEADSGVGITLADDRAMSQKSSPFKSIQTLSEYIALLLRETHE